MKQYKCENGVILEGDLVRYEPNGLAPTFVDCVVVNMKELGLSLRIDSTDSESYDYIPLSCLDKDKTGFIKYISILKR